MHLERQDTVCGTVCIVSLRPSALSGRAPVHSAGPGIVSTPESTAGLSPALYAVRRLTERSEPPLGGEPRRARLGGVEVDVVDARGRLSRQARGVEVVDVAHLAVRQVEDVEPQVEPVGEVIAGPRVEKARGVRARAVVRDQGPRDEIAQAQAAEEGAEAIERDTGRDHPLDSAGDVVPDRVE